MIGACHSCMAPEPALHNCTKILKGKELWKRLPNY